MESAKLEIEACIRDVELRMLINKLKKNKGKTDIAVFFFTLPPQVPTVKDIGVLFDDSLSSCYCHL